jgi:hypothetical protein
LAGNKLGMRTRRFLHDEPPLAELIDDPMIRAVMARDRVSREGLIEVIRTAQKHLKPEKIPA